MAEENKREAPTVKVNAVEVRPEEDLPAVTIYGVEVSTKDSAWCETFATEIELRAFFRGLQAGSQMTGGPYLSLPMEIPTATE